MIDELKQWEYDKGYEKGKADMLEIIEDIKEEIAKSLSIECEDLSYDDGFNNATRRALRIIDKHIGVGDNNEIDLCGGEQ